MKTATLPGFVRLSDQRYAELSVLLDLLDNDRLSEDTRSWAVNIINAVRVECFSQPEQEAK